MFIFKALLALATYEKCQESMEVFETQAEVVFVVFACALVCSPLVKTILKLKTAMNSVDIVGLQRVEFQIQVSL